MSSRAKRCEIAASRWFDTQTRNRLLPYLAYLFSIPYCAGGTPLFNCSSKAPRFATGCREPKRDSSRHSVAVETCRKTSTIWRSRSSQPPSQSPSKTRPRCIATVTGLFSFGFSCFSIGKFVLDCRLRSRAPRASAFACSASLVARAASSFACFKAVSASTSLRCAKASDVLQFEPQVLHARHPFSLHYLPVFRASLSELASKLALWWLAAPWAPIAKMRA